MNFCFTIMMFFGIISLFAQNNYGIKLNGGISRISNSFFNKLDKQYGEIHFPVQFAPSGQAGFFYNMQLNAKSLFGAEILFNQIEGREKWQIYFTDLKGSTTLQDIAYFYKHISYLTLPVYYGFKFRKLFMNIGGQVSLALYGIYKEGSRNLGELRNGEISPYIDNFDYGILVGFDYPVSPKFSMNLNLYQGINNILDVSGSDVKWRVTQLTAGIRYTLKKKKARRK